jgi:hypothetical protein
MSEPLVRLYDLALRTLDDQERRADALRSRLGPVLAAAALGVSVLSGPVVGGVHPAAATANTFTAMLWGILVMLCGLALTALVG